MLSKKLGGKIVNFIKIDKVNIIAKLNTIVFTLKDVPKRQNLILKNLNKKLKRK